MDGKSRFTIVRYTSLEEMKTDEYQYWQQQPPYDRVDALEEITKEAYGLYGTYRTAAWPLAVLVRNRQRDVVP